MAIKNATDLLVYKKTTPAQPQITRIKIKASTPFKDFTSGQNIIINNITDASGDISDGVTGSISANSGISTLSAISSRLVSIDGYTASAVGDDGAFKYIDYTNGANGPVPTLEVVSGTAEFKAGAVEIVVTQSGQSIVYQPIAYSTSASISMSTDLRDITTKDSEGWQENVAGVRSFEMSTDALWDVNNAVGVESAVNDLVSGDSVDVKFSDRVRNLVATEEVYGPAEWIRTTQIDLTKHLEDPFGQFTAGKYKLSQSFSNARFLYRAPIQFFEGKKLTWTFYIKGSGSNTTFSLSVYKRDGSSANASLNPVTNIISGSGTVGTPSGDYTQITGLSTSAWTRVQCTIPQAVSGNDLQTVDFSIYPGDRSSQTTASEVITASWQVETGTEASDYQNPTEVDCYQGKAFVNSVSIDAGVEENATYSASFTGTSELFVNGLGHELIADPYFDDGTNWWTADGSAIISSGSARIVWANGVAPDFSAISRNNMLTIGQKYCLEYTVSISVVGGLLIDGVEKSIPVSVGSHKVYFTPTSANFQIKRSGVVPEGFTSTDITLTYVSVKQVFS